MFYLILNSPVPQSVPSFTSIWASSYFIFLVECLFIFHQFIYCFLYLGYSLQASLVQFLYSIPVWSIIFVRLDNLLIIYSLKVIISSCTPQTKYLVQHIYIRQSKSRNDRLYITMEQMRRMSHEHECHVNIMRNEWFISHLVEKMIWKAGDRYNKNYDIEPAIKKVNGLQQAET